MPPTPAPTCARCGEPITAGARFCMKCGSDVSGEQGGVATAMLPAAEERDAAEVILQLLKKATIGEYEILRELGRGGMATVYLAHDIALDRKVAVKVMSPALQLMGEGMSERFKREARTAANLSHPNIIPIYTVKSSGKTLYFVMKFIAGRSLESIMKDIGPMPVPMTLSILQQVGSALGYAHRNGIVHRDVKPANIMIDEEGWSVVTDFGIAKVAENRGLTMTGIAVGTPSFMSPEQCAAKDITGKSDQYSLGVVAYEMLTGRQPFDGDSAMAIMFAHFHEQPRALAELRRDCPPAVAEAVMRMLEKPPEKRWGSLEDAIGAMGAAPLAHDAPARLQLIQLVRAKSNRQILDSITPPPTSPVPPAKPRPSGDPTTPIPTQRVVRVVVTPATCELELGQAIELRATVDRARRSTGVGPVWWTSSDVSVAEVSDNGQVTSTGLGLATISASCDGVTGTAEVAVVPVPVAQVVVEPAAMELEPGSALKLMVRVLSAQGQPLADRDIQWRVEPPGIVTVDQAGLVAAVAIGEARVIAECEDVAGISRLKVALPLVARITLTPADRKLQVGDTAALLATLEDGKGRTLAERPLTWTSSDPSVAAVSARGILTGLAEGKARIVVRCEGKEAAAAIQVVAVPVSSITIAQPEPLTVGDKVQLQVLLKDARGGVLAGRPVQWSSAASTIATVTGSGEVKAIAPGSAKVTAQCEGKSWTVTVSVQRVPAASIALSGLPASMTVGDNGTLTATVKDARGGVLTGREVTWASSDARILPVSARGVIRALSPGEATISAVVEGVKAEAKTAVQAVIVPESSAPTLERPASPPPVQARPSPPPVEPIPVPGRSSEPTVERPTFRPAGPTRTSAPVPSPVAAAEEEAMPQGSGRGKLIGIAVAVLLLAGVGFVLFRPRAPADIPPAPTPPVVVIGPAPVASVTIVGPTDPLAVGHTRQLGAELRDSAGLELTSRPVQWSSSDEAVAGVSTLGAVAGKRPGSVTITARSEGRSDDFGLVIEEAAEDAPAAVAGVSLTGGGRPLEVGKTLQLSAAPKDAKGGALADRTVVWQTENPQVARVSSTGLVTAVGPGQTVILASSEGKSAEVRVTVNRPPEPPRPTPPAVVAVAAVRLSAENVNLTAGQSTQLSATPLDGERKPLSGRSVSWTSSDERVARVSQDGTVTGVAKGTATITAQAETKSGSTQVTVADVPVVVAGVTLTPGGRSLKVGETANWTAVARDARGRELADHPVGWYTSAPRVATVREGVVTAVAPGTAEIRVEVEGKTASAGITVTPVAVAVQPQPQPNPPGPGPANPSASLLPRRGVEAGGTLSCGINNSGAVCWGGGESALSPVAGTDGLTGLTVGRGHACGLRAPGRAVCWGDNKDGQLGTGATAASAEAANVAGDLTFSLLTAGTAHTCGLSAGKAYCWGRGSEGQLGDGGTSSRRRPTAVKRGFVFVAISAGGNHTCALTAAGKAYCWGDGFSGQLGFGGQDRQTEPIDVSGDQKLTRIAAGGTHTCGLTAGGKAYCWGANESGQLGDGSKSDRHSPQPVTGNLSFSEIVAGGSHTCALAGTDGYCWGENRSGQLGDGSKTNRSRPVAITGGLNFASLSVGEGHSCGLLRGGEAACWGRNDRGQLGDGGTAAQSAPVVIR